MREFTKKIFTCLGLAGGEEKELSAIGKQYQSQVYFDIFPEAGDLGGGLTTQGIYGVHIGVKYIYFLEFFDNYMRRS